MNDLEDLHRPRLSSEAKADFILLRLMGKRRRVGNSFPKMGPRKDKDGTFG
jgi:hypothetical protein